MRKFIPSSPSATFASIFIVCSISFIIISACRKMAHHDGGNITDQFIRDRFFAITTSADPLIKAISDNIYKQDKQRNFVPDLVQKAGYPIWDKAKIVTNNTMTRLDGGGGSTELVLIPFVKNDNYVTNAILAAKVNPALKDTVFSLLYATNYSDFGFDNRDTTLPDARDVFHLFTAFDKEIFGYSIFSIKDRRLFNKPGVDTSRPMTVRLKTTAFDQQGRLLAFTVCDVYDVCIGPPNQTGVWDPSWCANVGGCTVDCQYWDHEERECSTIWIDDGGGSGGSWGGGLFGGFGEGGGSGGWENTNPCRPIPGIGTNPCTGGGGNGGWAPVTDEDEEVPASIINNLNNLCLKNILRRLTTSANSTLFTQIYNIFDTASNLHLQFTEDSLTGAYGTCTWYDSSGVGPFASIVMDTTVLLNSSQEWIAYVFIHEIAHAGMDANIVQWDTTNSQHAAMVTAYLSQMVTGLQTIYPGLPLFDAYAMCYAGFNNGLIDGSVMGEAAFMYLMLKKVKMNLNNHNITTNELIQRGEEYTDIGTRGLRVNCR